MTSEMRKHMIELCSENHFANYNHIRLTEFDDDRAVMVLQVGHDSLNPLGMPHGGVLYTMGDCAAGISARTDGRCYVTLSSSFTFLRSAQEGDCLEARAEVLRRGGTTCDVEVRVFDQHDVLLAVGNYLFYCLKPDSEKHDEPL